MFENHEEQRARIRRTFEEKLQQGDLFNCGGDIHYIMVKKGSNIYHFCEVIELHKANRIAIAEGKKPATSSVSFEDVEMLQIVSVA